jgi:hypothetical protein
MAEDPEPKRWVSISRPIEVSVYKKTWSSSPTAEQTERMLIKHLITREADGPFATYKGFDHQFIDVSVHAWVDMIADGIALEIRTSELKEFQYGFIPRKDLQDNFMYKVTDTNSCSGVLVPTARGVWLAEAEPFIPPNACFFLRRVPLEELYGYQTLVWGHKHREFPAKIEIQRAALDGPSLHVKLYGRFVAV